MVAVGAGHEVTVQVHRDRDGRVAELAGHVDDGHASAKHQTGVGVPGVVNAHVTDAGPFQEGPPDAIAKPGVIEGLGRVGG
jgi:hypothetical protein